MPDFHNYIELLTPAILGVLGWVGKAWSTRMHLENQALLSTIDRKIDRVDYKIDTHVALDDVQHDEYDRRIKDLEDRRRGVK